MLYDVPMCSTKLHACCNSNFVNQRIGLWVLNWAYNGKFEPCCDLTCPDLNIFTWLRLFRSFEFTVYIVFCCCSRNWRNIVVFSCRKLSTKWDCWKIIIGHLLLNIRQYMRIINRFGYVPKVSLCIFGFRKECTFAMETEYIDWTFNLWSLKRKMRIKIEK